MPGSDLTSLLTRTPVVPVLMVESVGTALPLARALVDGGLTVLEITLRTPAALDVDPRPSRARSRARWSVPAPC